MPLTTTYTLNNAQAALVLIGNTLGLSKAAGTLLPGTLGSIGAFITTNSALQAPGWPINTTLNWQQNSSTAVLSLPAGSTVIHAELYWCADYISGAINLSANVANSITLTDPSGTAHSVAPTDSTLNISLTENTSTNTSYQNIADVTAIVNAGGNGTWTCGGVPCALNAADDYLNYAGWAMQIVYTNPSLLLTNIVIQKGPNKSVDVPYNATINYAGPPLSLNSTLGFAEGDAIITGDYFILYPSTIYSGPNNPALNVFSSQINYPGQGQNTSGLFGTVNANAAAATNVSGGRQGWDIMNLPLSYPTAATTVSSDIPSNNDPGFIYTLGFASQALQPAVTINKTVDRSYAINGDVITYTLVVNNVFATATNVVFYDSIPAGSTFVSNSVTLNSVTQPGANPQGGISLGTLPVNSTNTLTFKVTATPPYLPTGAIDNLATIAYSFAGTTFGVTSNDALTTIVSAVISTSKTVSKSFANVLDVVTYTIPITNTGNTTIYNIIFKDTIPSGTTLVPNSFKQDGVVIATSPTPPGTTLPASISALGTSTITFQVTINTIPSPNPIPNSANVVGTYTIDTTTVPTRTSTTTANTNIVTTQVNNANLSTTVKTVDKLYADCGDIITYTVLIPNIGNVTAQNIVFSDTIPSGTVFVANSLTVNGVTQVGSNPQSGVTIPNIAPGTTSTVTFKVRVQC